MLPIALVGSDRLHDAAVVVRFKNFGVLIEVKALLVEALFESKAAAHVERDF
jgi:hypothetical protein